MTRDSNSDADKAKDELTETEFARHIGVSVRTLQNWRRGGSENAPPFFHLGGMVRYSLRQYEEWKDRSKKTFVGQEVKR